MKSRFTNWPATIALILGTLIILYPLYMTFIVALKTPREIVENPMAWPSEWRWDNFVVAFQTTNYPRAFFNSLFVTSVSVLFTVLTNSLVGYAVARNMHRPFFKVIYYYFLSALFLPFPIIMLPLVKETTFLGMNNQIGLTILHIVYGLAFNVFIYVGYIKSLPKELEEAAIIDGCTPWQTFWQVIFPLLLPINATIAILTTLGVWNDFLLPLVILSEPGMATLPLMQYVFQLEFHTQNHFAFASYIMVMAPLLIVYIFAQRWIISGITSGSVKE